VTKWMIRAVMILAMLAIGFGDRAQAQSIPTTVEALGFVGGVTDGGGTTFGGGMQFGSGRLIFAAEVGYLTLGNGFRRFGTDFDTSAVSVDLDAHYLFPLANNEKVTPYVLGGLGILRFKASAGNTDVTETDTGLNLGAGLRLTVGRNWGFRPEVKFLVKNDTSTRISVGMYLAF